LKSTLLALVRLMHPVRLVLWNSPLAGSYRTQRLMRTLCISRHHRSFPQTKVRATQRMRDRGRHPDTCPQRHAWRRMRARRLISHRGDAHTTSFATTLRLCW